MRFNNLRRKKMSEVVKNKNEAEQIWKEIEDLPISMFALPNQTVKQHVIQLPVPGKELLLKLVSTATLPALEEALNNTRLTGGKRYEIEIAEGYVIVRRASSRKEELKKVLAPFVIAK